MTKNITIALLVIISVVSVLYGLQQKQRADDNESRATKSEQLVKELTRRAEQASVEAAHARSEMQRQQELVQAQLFELKKKN